MEEIQEADVLWPDVAHHHHRPDYSHGHRRQLHLTLTGQQPHAAAASAVVRPLQSPPVRIPSMPPVEARPTSRNPWTRSYDDDGGGGGGAEAEAGIVPPHVLAARRCAEERRVASSVCVGHGRTLKGRDLRAVRNAVLHMTGFLSNSDDYC